MASSFVPRMGFLLVIGLATTLIGVIVLRSPDTHANLWTELDPTYTRTEVATLAGEMATEAHPTGMSLLVPSVSWQTALPLDPGRQVYLRAACGTCHGLDARGGPVAPSLANPFADFPGIVKKMVREGPGGMPIYSEAQLSDADLATLATYLQALAGPRPDFAEIAALQRLTYDPSVPKDVLLGGKAAIRRSCGACHGQPDREDILRAFSSDAEAAGLVAEMVAETNLSLEDAEAITHYMLAIINGYDLVRAP